MLMKVRHSFFFLIYFPQQSIKLSLTLGFRVKQIVTPHNDLPLWS